MRAEILGLDDSPTTGSSVSSVVLPQNLAPAARRKHQTTNDKDAQEGTRPLFHNGFGLWDKKQHFWGQLGAMGIPTVLEANSGKQLSLQCRLRRSWGLAKFRMTGTPKEKR